MPVAADFPFSIFEILLRVEKFRENRKYNAGGPPRVKDCVL